MNKRFLMVTYLDRRVFSDEELAQGKEVYNKATDWLYVGSANVLFLYTNVSIDRWYARLRELLNKDDQLLISEFDPETAQGRMRKWVWDWLLWDRTTSEFVGDAIDRKRVAVTPRPGGP